MRRRLGRLGEKTVFHSVWRNFSGHFFRSSQPKLVENGAASSLLTHLVGKLIQNFFAFVRQRVLVPKIAKPAIWANASGYAR